MKQQQKQSFIPKILTRISAGLITLICQHTMGMSPNEISHFLPDGRLHNSLSEARLADSQTQTNWDEAVQR